MSQNLIFWYLVLFYTHTCQYKNSLMNIEDERLRISKMYDTCGLKIWKIVFRLRQKDDVLRLSCCVVAVCVQRKRYIFLCIPKRAIELRVSHSGENSIMEEFTTTQ